jgi:pimeloyl-ACP methyl ester carboxylesterase
MGTDFNISAPGQFVVVEGLRLHYVSQGAGDPIVLLHGNAGFIHDYSAIIRHLAERGYRVLAFDRPGHGQSERSAGALATVEDQARLIYRALLELGVEKPILVGHSWGGLLTLAYTLRYETEISAAVLLAPAAYPEASQFEAQRALIRIPGLGHLIIRMSSPFIDREIRRNLERAFSPDEVPTDYLRLATAIWNRPEQIRAIVEDEANFNPTAEGLNPRYHEISVPTLIITGDSDLLVKPETHAFPLHRAISHSSLVVLPETGHMLPQTRPEAVLKAIQTVSAQSTQAGPV